MTPNTASRCSCSTSRLARSSPSGARRGGARGMTARRGACMPRFRISRPRGKFPRFAAAMGSLPSARARAPARPPAQGKAKANRKHAPRPADSLSGRMSYCRTQGRTRHSCSSAGSARCAAAGPFGSAAKNGPSWSGAIDFTPRYVRVDGLLAYLDRRLLMKPRAAGHPHQTINARAAQISMNRATLAILLSRCSFLHSSLAFKPH